MAHTRCRNGHIYDMDIYGDSCPYCGSVTSTIRFDASARREITFSEQRPVRPAGAPGTPGKRESGREITFFSQGPIRPTEPAEPFTGRESGREITFFDQRPIRPTEPAEPFTGRESGREITFFDQRPIRPTEPAEPLARRESGREITFFNQGPIRPTEPAEPSPRMAPGSGGAQRNGPADAAQQDFGKTVPAFAVNMSGNKEKDLPVIVPAVGWLVCVDGPVKGLDFTLHAQINRIGSGSGMDVCIPGDDAISADTHAKIVYDRRHAVCHLLPGNDGSILSLNGDPVLGPQKLSAYDRLRLGRTELLFVPFCNERFAWADGE